MPRDYDAKLNFVLEGDNRSEKAMREAESGLGRLQKGFKKYAAAGAAAGAAIAGTFYAIKILTANLKNR